MECKKCNKEFQAYSVSEGLWDHWMKDDTKAHICIPCLEDKMKRKLTPWDFDMFGNNRENDYVCNLFESYGFWKYGGWCEWMELGSGKISSRSFVRYESDLVRIEEDLSGGVIERDPNLTLGAALGIL